MDLGRSFRGARTWLAQSLRPKIIVALLFITVLAAALLWLARPVADFWPNVALNLGADLIGAIVVIFVVSPLITRAQVGRVREHAQLDYNWFIDQIVYATADVRILDTFTGLLRRPGPRFLRVAGRALARGVRLRILLIDPDSLAAAQRSAELGDARHSDVRSEVLQNIRTLARFQTELLERDASRFEVRLYSAAGSVSLYRWDDRALVSFLPIRRLSGEGTQLEIGSASSLWLFVGDRFEELWQHAKPLAEFLTLSLDVVDAAGQARPYRVPFVRVGEHYFIDAPEVLADMAVHAGDTLRARMPSHPGLSYQLEVFSGDPEILQSVMTYYGEKYERSGSTFACLRPLTGREAPRE